MRLLPIGPYAHLGQQGHGELGHARHQRGHLLAQPVGLVGGQLKHQFVVHLHDEQHVWLGGIQPVLHGDHGFFDQVGRRALHGGVDGGAFGRFFARAVAAVDIRQIQAAAKHGLHIALGVGQGHGVVHIAFHAGVALKVAVDVGGSGLVVDA